MTGAARAVAAQGLHRRRATVAALALLLGVAGCNTAPPGAMPESTLSFGRTFDAALGAIAEQKMVIEEDRRFGRIVGRLNGDTVTAALAVQLDGAISVRFDQQGSNDPELLTRVIAGYNARMSGQSVLGGFRDSGNSTGPVPCPSGPALCK